MLSVSKAAVMLPSHAASAAACRSPLSPAAVCQCAAHNLQASRAKATMEEACTCLEFDTLTKPVPVRRPAAERRPAFHLAPTSGWINDPNGPFLHKGTYHLFYQHVPNSSEWQWGLVWGHAKSQDLVNWEHLPVALEPTPNSLDQHGCFSGCATVDVDGRPTILYTGVIRKAPHEIEQGMSHQHEAQIIAVATDLDDPDLTHWQKLPGSFLPHPPADMDLTGWRDPFVLERPSAGSPWWYVMVGAGVRDKCGTAMVYRSQDLSEGWEYVGPLCESPSSRMWECPVMAHLSTIPPSSTGFDSTSITSTATGSTATGNKFPSTPAGQPQQGLQRHLFSVSPDYCVNMIQYWLGEYAEGKFDLQVADGPFLLDHGDIMYAPNLLTDKQGRTVLWAWMQEKQHMRPPGSYSNACCLCVPRALYLSPDGKNLLQEPLPELRELRQQEGAWHAGAAAVTYASGCNSTGVTLLPGLPMRLGDGSNVMSSSSSSSSMDLELKVAKGDADSFALVLHPFAGAVGASGAAITYCWSTNTLQVVYSTDPATLQRVTAMPLEPRPYYTQGGPDPVQLAALEATAAEPGMPSRCGGRLRAPAAGTASPASTAEAGEVLSLRVLLDGSCVEVFTGSGEALGTRVYRGDEAPAHHSMPQHGVDAALGLSSPAAAAMAAAAAAGAVKWEELFSSGVNSSSSSPGGGLAGGELDLVCFGPGPATLLSCSAWQMSNMWQRQLQQQQEGELATVLTAAPASAALPVPAATAVTAAAAEVLQGLVVAEAAAVAAAAAAAVAPVVLPVGGLSLDMCSAATGLGNPLSPLSPSGRQVHVDAA